MRSWPDWFAIPFAVLLIIMSLWVLFGCESKEEYERRWEKKTQFLLQRECVKHHGSPIMENGKLVKCEYRGIFKYGRENQ